MAKAPALVLGQYRPFVRYAQGGMADVLLARSESSAGLERIVVLKRLREDLDDETGSMAKMFVDEARLCLALSHPGIVPIYDVGEHEGAFYIAMEFVEGQPLSKVRASVEKAGETIPAELAVRIAVEVLAALHYAHEYRDREGRCLEIVHRDVSPQNILLGYDGRVRLLDFGVAKAHGREVKTEAGVFKGKVRYMAPEQVLSAREEIVVDRRADIFALGVVLWEMLTGKRMGAQNDDFAALVALVQLDSPLPNLSSAREGCDPILERIVERALCKRLEARYATALEMRRDLERWLASRTEEVRLEDVLLRHFKAERERLSARIREAVSSMPSSSRPTPPTSELGELGADIDVDHESSVSERSRSRSRSRSMTSSGTPFRGVTLASQQAPEGPSPSAPVEVPARSVHLALGVAVLAALTCTCVVVVLSLRPTPVGPRGLAPSLVVAADPSVIATAVDVLPSSMPELPNVIASSSNAARTISSGTSDRPKTAAPAFIPPRKVYGQPEAPKAPVAASAATPVEAAHTAPTPPGFLTLDTYPATKVSIDGRDFGETPIVRAPLMPGVHRLTFSDNQGLSRTSQVEIKSGETTARRLSFE